MLLAEVLQELRSLPPEQLIQPELKPHREAQDQKIREDQDLADGAVLQAVVSAGEGEDTPQEGDLVFVHVAITNAEGDETLWSSHAEQGGSGQPLAFTLLKGARAPRAWEIALAGMRKGARTALKVRPSYGFLHPTCTFPAPPGVRVDQVLGFDMELLGWAPAKTVRPCGPGGRFYRHVIKEGTSFETPRAPFEVTLNVTLRTLAYDGAQQTGAIYFSTTQGAWASSKGVPQQEVAALLQPLMLTMGSQQAPEGLEEALSHMSRGERALYILPADTMQPPAGGNCKVPAPPSRALQVEAEVELLSIVQVRDMTGTGEVLKRRVKEGQGEFPIDCPLHDTAMRMHFRVRGVRGGTPGPWLLDTRADALPPQQQQAPAGRGQGGADVARPPLEIDTGCGDAPEAVEMCLKLMVPGELSLVTALAPKYAYEGRQDAPQGLEGCEAVEWEVELVSFDKEGHWQAITFDERFALVERVKGKANALVKQGRHAYARARYERLLRMMESTRDWNTDEEISKMEAYKVAVLLNLALCDMALNEPAQAVAWCDKALSYDDKNAKAWFRRGRALGQKGDYDDAEPDLRRAAELDPSLLAEVDKEVAAIQKKAKAAAAKQKSTFKNFFDR